MFPLFLRRTFLLFIVTGALALTVTPSLPAKSADSGDGTAIDINFFYDTLKDDGSWYNTSEYGDVWQPYIAYKSDSWRPYTDGYWSYTDGGWMFVSNENFGWAVYHYGRWTRLKDIGWAWVPGTDWAPAWVTWRASKTDGGGPPAGPDSPAPAAAIDATSTSPATDDKNVVPPADAPSSAAPRPPVVDQPAGGGPPVSENYVGWAPLPPEPAAYTEVGYTYGPTVDVDFGVDPYDYCFTDVRYFGSPYVAAVIFDPGRSYYCCDHSVNITNIYYNRSGQYRGFYAGGPDYDHLRGLSQHPIPQYNLRQTTGASARAAIRDGRFNRVTGNTIGVAAPQFSRKSVGPNGRVVFTRAGALAKAQISQGAPGAAADDPAYKQARESFTRQNESFRKEHPNAPVSRAAALQAAGRGDAVPETASKIETTPRAQQEERAARQAAGENTPPTETREQALKEHAPGNPEARSEDGQGKPETAGNHQESSTPETTQGKTHRSRRAARLEAAREAADHPSESRATKERRAPVVTHEEAAGSAGHARGGSVPHAEPRSAPRVVAPPRPPAPSGGGSGAKPSGGEDKKKKN